MNHVTLDGGDLDYRVVTPNADSTIGAPADRPTALFVHGLLTNGALWDGVAERLAAHGVASVIPDWPLGSHRRPWGGRELSPTSLASAIGELCETLELEHVILVGSDTGGALCQLALRAASSRVDGLVLTNCDAFEAFPPRFFAPIFFVARYRIPTWFLFQNTRIRVVRHSPLAYGPLLNHPISASLTRSWVDPALGDARIRHDLNRFARAHRGDELVEAAAWLGDFNRPTKIVWGMRDRHFVPELGERLAAAMPDAEFITVDAATTFVSVDDPDAVAAAVVACTERTDGSHPQPELQRDPTS